MPTIKEIVVEHNEDAIIFDDLDDAIIGIGQQHGMHTVAVYDRDKCIEILMDKFDEEDDALTTAIEYFEYNVLCLYAGKNTPIIIERFG